MASTGGTGGHHVKWADFGACWGGGLHRLKEWGHLTDVTLVTSDFKNLGAHKVRWDLVRGISDPGAGGAGG